MKAKYLVGSMFGCVPEETIIDCYILTKGEDGRALIYHPANTKYIQDGEERTDDGSASVDICRLNSEGQWVSVDENSYMNIKDIDPKFKELISSVDENWEQIFWQEKRVFGVVCHWNFDENEEKPWTLEERYPIDEDGYDLASYRGKQHRWDEWMYKRDRDGYNAGEIIGRAVTMWNFSCGVRLMGWHPKKFMKSVSPSFYENLLKSRDWQLVLKGAHEPYFRTLAEAQRIFDSQSRLPVV